MSSVVVCVPQSRTAACSPRMTDEVRWLEQQQQQLQSELRLTRSKALRLLTRLEQLSGTTPSNAVGSEKEPDTAIDDLQAEYQQLEQDILCAKKALLHVMNKLEHAAPRPEEELDDSQRLTV